MMVEVVEGVRVEVVMKMKIKFKESVNLVVEMLVAEEMVLVVREMEMREAVQEAVVREEMN